MTDYSDGACARAVRSRTRGADSFETDCKGWLCRAAANGRRRRYYSAPMSMVRELSHTPTCLADPRRKLLLLDRDLSRPFCLHRGLEFLRKLDSRNLFQLYGFELSG